MKIGIRIIITQETVDMCNNIFEIYDILDISNWSEKSRYIAVDNIKNKAYNLIKILKDDYT
ncbi:MAG: hypothetical protein ACTSQJ_06080 [Promethearchaeota archaeon]